MTPSPAVIFVVGAANLMMILVKARLHVKRERERERESVLEVE